MPGDTASGLIRARVVYAGRVQGVGFRYTALGLSGNYDVAGHVRNQPDGTVELEAQGAVDKVEAFLKAVTENFAGHIREERRSDLAPMPSEREFQIRI